MKPIKPEEIKVHIPDSVIDIFNRLIKKNWNGVESKVLSSEIVNEIIHSTNIKDAEILDKRYLDAEPLYRDVGWIVEYHQTSFNEPWYPPYFIFRKPLKNEKR